jgi:hypothetical protein
MGDKKKSVSSKTLPFKETKYETDYSWKQSPLRTAKQVRTTAEMLAFLESSAGKGVELEAKVLAVNDQGEFGYRKLSKAAFSKSFRENARLRTINRFRESFDNFSSGSNGGSSFSNPNGAPTNIVGSDFTPLLGGPFYKQLYYYNDWLKAHQDCFFAYHHDPIAKALTNIFVDFTLGSGYKVECENKVAQALWDAFEEANDFKLMFVDFAKELSVYGEHIFWWLPNHNKYITFPQTVKSEEDVKKVILPRIRLVDPSNIVEIITYPEDITRKLAYVWLTPTQYQTYTTTDPNTGKLVDGTKFIYQQIPAAQMDHIKVNAVSNEKRGRSDLFAALPYTKRLRDTVNYCLIGLQKAAAWAIDTTIEGSDADIQNYVAAQQELGTIAPAGSEHVHTKAITRQYLGNTVSGGNKNESFEWCLSMACASYGIPVSYVGTHLSGGSTRASAIIATEPVTKRFEMRRQIYQHTLRNIAQRLFKSFGIQSNIEITFPELVAQDRSAKLKDLYLAETAKWISPERAAQTAAQELGYTDYAYDKELLDIVAQAAQEPAPMASPLSSPGASQGSSSAVTSDEKKEISDNDGS